MSRLLVSLTEGTVHEKVPNVRWAITENECFFVELGRPYPLDVLGYVQATSSALEFKYFRSC